MWPQSVKETFCGGVHSIVDNCYLLFAESGVKKTHSFIRLGCYKGAQTGRDFKTVHSLILCKPIKFHIKLTSLRTSLCGVHGSGFLLGNHYISCMCN